MKRSVNLATGLVCSVGLSLFMMGGVAAAQSTTVTSTGPDSGNTVDITTKNNCEATINNNNNVNVSNGNNQNSNSGNGSSNQNTSSGNTSSGNSSTENSSNFNVNVSNNPNNPCSKVKQQSQSQPVGGKGAVASASTSTPSTPTTPQVQAPKGGVSAGEGGSGFFSAVIGLTVASAVAMAVRLRKLARI